MIIPCVNLIASIIIIVLLAKLSEDIKGIPVKDEESQLYYMKLKQNNNWFLFIIDSGATQSVISKDALEYLSYENTSSQTSLYGIDGNKTMSNIIHAKFSYRKTQYEEDFIVIDSSALVKINEDANKTNIIGILGLTFLEKYKGVINFKNKTIIL